MPVTTEAPEHSPEVYALAIAAAIVVDPFAELEPSEDEQLLAVGDELAQLEALDTFDIDAWIEARDAELAAAGAAPVESEPDYFLYGFGPEDNTAFWLSDVRLDGDDSVRYVGSGDALYAKFGQLGMYQDMTIAFGYGGIRPIEQGGTLHLMDPADL